MKQDKIQIIRISLSCQYRKMSKFIVGNGNDAGPDAAEASGELQAGWFP